MPTVLRAIVLLAALAAPIQAQVHGPATVSGVVRSSDGTVLHDADVRVAKRGDRAPLATARTDSLGRFVIGLPAAGLAQLIVSAPHHTPFIEVAWFTSLPARLDVRLARIGWADSFPDVRAMGDFNGWSWDSAQALAKQGDGTFTLRLDSLRADTLAYQLIGATTSGREANGTDGLRYSVAAHGSYRTVIPVVNGSATISFNPAALERDSTPMEVRWSPAASRQARLWRAQQFSDSLWRAYWRSTRTVTRAEPQATFDLRPGYDHLQRALRTERDPDIREYLLLALLTTGSNGRILDSATAVKVLRVPPTSPWWSWNQFALASRSLAVVRAEQPGGDFKVLRSVPHMIDAYVAFMDSVAELNPDRELRADALANNAGMLHAAGQLDRSADYVARLGQDYPDSPATARARVMYSPRRVLQVGAQIPDFSFPTLDGRDSLTRAGLLGTVYLLDFWATWCSPCITEMPHLHRAYADWADSGFTIVSVSADGKADDVIKLRAGEWTMPWKHAWLPLGMEDPTIKRTFEILFLPRAALVGRDGTILAVDNEVRGTRLDEAVRKAMAGSPPP